MVAAEVATAPMFTLGQQHVLFSATPYRRATQHPQYDVTPDDRHFLMVRPTGAGDFELIVVENFFEELRERARGS